MAVVSDGEEPCSSSRESVAAAGWECEPESIFETGKAGFERFSWLNPKPLWRSRNDRVARALGDPVDDLRRGWIERLGKVPTAAVDCSRADGSTSFLVVGDTGEGDESQAAVVGPLLERGVGTDFMFICSDVIYPAAGAGEYERKFFDPYAGFEGDIYAVPGNHDWYDDCTGFMHWFCGASLEQPPRVPVGLSPLKLLRKLIWRRPERVAPARLAEIGQAREMPGQPGPYFTLDTGPVLLVGIDTGILGGIDRDQAEWLQAVSAASPKPKILLTGKPIYVDGNYHAGSIEGERELTVDKIVTKRENNYIAAIGGDIHNYQRYPARLDDGRTMLYLVSGGGGAFMHETHAIDRMDRLPAGERVDEKDFRCYPLRGDSLSLYSKLYARKVGRIGRLLGARPIPANVASAILSEVYDMPATRPAARETTVDARSRRIAKVLLKLPGKGRGALHLPFSEWLDWNSPPLFKSFLRIDADADGVRIRCFAATGCERAGASNPCPEDDLRWTSASGWSWPE